MLAAAAAMAAASQWPNATSTPMNGHSASGSVQTPLTPAPIGQHTAPAAVDAAQSPSVAALAAAAAAAAWRWFSPATVAQHNGSGALLTSSPTAACGQSASQQQVSGALYENLFTRLLCQQQQSSLSVSGDSGILEESRSAKRPRLKQDE